VDVVYVAVVTVHLLLVEDLLEGVVDCEGELAGRFDAASGEGFVQYALDILVYQPDCFLGLEGAFLDAVQTGEVDINRSFHAAYRNLYLARARRRVVIAVFSQRYPA
jgi:hypothetical protein